MTRLTADELAAVEDACRRAFARGKEQGRADTLAVIKGLTDLNGPLSRLVAKAEGADRHPPADDATAGPHVHLLAKMLDLAIGHAEADDDDTDPLHRLADLADDPGAWSELFGEPHPVHKGFDSDKHPRDDRGRFVSKDAIQDAKTDPAKADELRARVTDPGQRKKLDAALGGDVDLGRTKAGQKRHDAQTRRAKREESHRRADEIARKVILSGGDPPTADEWRELAGHLPNLTVQQLRDLRGLVGANLGGAKLRQDVLDRLHAHAKFESGDWKRPPAAHTADAAERSRGKLNFGDTFAGMTGAKPAANPAAPAANTPPTPPEEPAVPTAATAPPLDALHAAWERVGTEGAMKHSEVNALVQSVAGLSDDDAATLLARTGFRPLPGVRPHDQLAKMIADRRGAMLRGLMIHAPHTRQGKRDAATLAAMNDGPPAPAANTPPTPPEEPAVPTAAPDSRAADAAHAEAGGHAATLAQYASTDVGRPVPARDAARRLATTDERDAGDLGPAMAKLRMIADAGYGRLDGDTFTLLPAPDFGPARPEVVGRLIDSVRRRAGPDNLASLADVRRDLPDVPLKDLHAAVQHVRRTRQLVPSSIEGYEGVSPEERDASVRDGRELIGHLRLPPGESAGPAPAGPPSPEPAETAAPPPEPAAPRGPVRKTPAEAAASDDWLPHEMTRDDYLAHLATLPNESVHVDPKRGVRDEVFPGDTVHVPSRGGKAWVAKIGGEDKRYGREREFLRSRETRSGMRKQIVTASFTPTEPGEYEVGGDEFGKFRHTFTVSDSSAIHRQEVEKALKAGRPVHPDVLADYPDLAAKDVKPPKPAGAPKARHPGHAAYESAPAMARDAIESAAANLPGTVTPATLAAHAAKGPREKRDAADQLVAAWRALHDDPPAGTTDADRAAMTAALPLFVPGLRQSHAAGEVVPFDGSRHSAPDSVSTGERRAVTRAGWVLDEGDGFTHVPLKAAVGPAHPARPTRRRR